MSGDFITDSKQEYSYISVHQFLLILLVLDSSASPLHLIATSTEMYSVEPEGQGSFSTDQLLQDVTTLLTDECRSHFYIRQIAKRWAFGLSICLLSSCPCICNKAGDNTPFLHPSPAGSRGSCPTYLTILAPGLPLTTVASFVTCQLIRPHRHITSVGRQQGLEQLQSLFFKKSYQMFTESYPKGFNGSLSMLPTEQHLQVSKRCDFINSSTGSGSYQGPRFFLFSSKHCDRYKWRGIATHATLQHSLAARIFQKVLVHHCSLASEP